MLAQAKAEVDFDFYGDTTSLLSTGQLIIIMATMKKLNAVMNLLALNTSS